ncbi:pyridoxal 5'-phosphate synthase [Bacillus sp. Marseille-Q1617]|uniref:pyridoxine/pyridoxamine 5'-phosphate oxidase n=1 Tax=Bacillus sp. Marseille-Q1617 TaxID=2736887 RepID=UPI0020CA2ADD|nr:pyridoxal 5'-phosphate synthase [Bacillus sp. Marseille-Q1617]
MNRIRNLKTLTGPFPYFNVNDAPQSPHELFLDWFQLAVDKGIPEPHSMTLSTIDNFGFPDARILILKDVDEKGWYFASSSQSEKGKQIEAHPYVALTFYWPLIGRQVRIRGKAMKMDEEQNSKDFLSRGTVARAIALLGKQSAILNDQQEFEEALSKQIQQMKLDPDQVDPHWTLYRVEANSVEFWQADEDRKHIRLRYELERETWLKDRLYP